MAPARASCIFGGAGVQRSAMARLSALPDPLAVASTMLEAQQENRLLAAFGRGDRQAAEQLAASTYRTTFTALFRLTGGDRELAADLTQETYRKAWKALPGFRGGSRLATWLYRIAYTTFLNHIRRPQPVEPLAEEQAAVLRDPAPGQDQSLDRGEVADRLRRAVVGLPEELRFTVCARFWGDCSVAEIARSEKVTGAAIRKRLKRAMGWLRVTLEENP